MDADLFARIAGTGIALVAGSALKKKGAHKVAGPTSNVAIAAAVVGVADYLGASVDVQSTLPLEIAATTELAVQGGKSLVRAIRGIGGILGRFM